jgi:CRP-like cAMP-binding protein
MRTLAPAREAVSLPQIPLLAGIAASDIERLEHFMARFEVAEGERLFQQHDQSACMHVIERGRVEVHLQMPDGGTQTLARLGPGEVLGEISLLQAATRSASAVALEPTSGWVLYPAALETLRIDGGTGSVELMARLTELAVARLRARYVQLAAALGDARSAPLAAPSLVPSVPAAPELWGPDYLHSLLCFRQFHDHAQVMDAIGAVVPYELPRGSALSAREGEADALVLVIRGAVDVSLKRGGAAQCVRLAGPGRFVGHLGVLDAGPNPAVAHARERVVLVALPGERIRAMLRDPSAVARRLSAAIAVDTARALRQAERPIARTHLE